MDVTELHNCFICSHFYLFHFPSMLCFLQQLIGIIIVCFSAEVVKGIQKNTIKYWLSMINIKCNQTHSLVIRLRINARSPEKLSGECKDAQYHVSSKTVFGLNKHCGLLGCKLQYAILISTDFRFLFLSCSQSISSFGTLFGFLSSSGNNKNNDENHYPL